MTPTYVVWCRHSAHARLDGYVSATTYRPSGDSTCTFEVLLETTDWDAAHHRIATERYGPDITAHLDANCPICWTTTIARK